MTASQFARTACVVLMCGAATVRAGSQEGFSDTAAVTQFSRSVDSYAFLHRQVQRHLGEDPAAGAMAAGMRAARPAAADGDIFTPVIAAAFRSRIAYASQTRGCGIAWTTTRSSEVPRVGASGSGTLPIPDCLSVVLPHLPQELEYRVASVALILLDTHANMVVDVLHGAFPTSP